MAVLIHQLLHGYSQGHQLLAGSIRLDESNASLIRRLSDLSGASDPENPTPSYLTAYPLPSGKFFALARTWPDEEAPRAGCVLTHTLLIDPKLLAQVHSPRLFSKFFHLTDGRADLDRYSIPLNYVSNDQVFSEASLPTPYQREFIHSFVQRFHSQGRRPLVGFDAPNPDELFWQIWESFWPQLRIAFSACSYALQPRKLQSERYFDIVFASSTVASRFRALPLENQFSVQPSEPGHTDEPWLLHWEKLVWEERCASWGKKSGFWHQLSSDPTELKKLFLLEELKQKVNANLLALIGILDIVDSLAPQPADNLHEKSALLDQAAILLNKAEDPEDALHFAFLLNNRLLRPSFRQVASSQIAWLPKAIAYFTEKSRDTALELSERSIRENFWKNEDTPSSNVWASSLFLQGVTEGFTVIVEREPHKLGWLLRTPELFSLILNAKPYLAVYYLDQSNSISTYRFDGSQKYATSHGINEELIADITVDLIEWFFSSSSPDDPSYRHDFIRALIHHLSIAHAPSPSSTTLIQKLVKNIGNDDVVTILDVFFLEKLELQHSWLKEHINLVAEIFPESVRNWSYALDDAYLTPHLAKIISSTYPSSSLGLDDILADRNYPSVLHLDIIAEWLRRAQNPSLPEWLVDRLEKSGDCIHVLLQSVTPTEVIISQMREVVSQLDRLRLSSRFDLAKSIEEWPDNETRLKLTNLALNDVLLAWKDGALEEKSLVTWNSWPLASDWARRIPSWELKRVLLHEISFSKSSEYKDGYANGQNERVWQWLVHAPETLYRQRQDLFADLVRSVAAISHPWTFAFTEHWQLIFSRARRISPDLWMRLCMDSLEFSFSHTNYPVSQLVVEAFPPIYRQAVDHDTDFLEISYWLGYIGWDKGKELRHRLVKCFLHSPVWAPGDLAIASARVGLLKKIFKRTLRQPQGERYIEVMLKDLAQRQNSSDKQIRPVLQELQTLARNPNFIELWD
jgi:hypothetical protein